MASCGVGYAWGQQAIAWTNIDLHHRGPVAFTPGQVYDKKQVYKFAVTSHIFQWQLVNIGSGSGLVLSGNEPLPEPILTQIYVAIWFIQAKWI